MLAEDVLKMEKDNRRLRDENAKLREVLGMDLPKPMDCEHCRFFIQHYVRVGLQYAKTYAGHCGHGRIKDRKPDEKGCKYFEAGQWK